MQEGKAAMIIPPDEVLRTTIAELILFAKSEYIRGLRDGANMLHAHADRREVELGLTDSVQCSVGRTPTRPLHESRHLKY